MNTGNIIIAVILYLWVAISTLRNLVSTPENIKPIFYVSFAVVELLAKTLIVAYILSYLTNFFDIIFNC